LGWLVWLLLLAKGGGWVARGNGLLAALSFDGAVFCLL